MVGPFRLRVPRLKRNERLVKMVRDGKFIEEQEEYERQVKGGEEDGGRPCNIT